MDILMSTPLPSGRCVLSARVRDLLRHATLLFIGVCALTPVAKAKQTPLTLGTAQQVAVLQSLQVKASDFAVSATTAAAPTAGKLPDPIMTLSIENMPVEGPDSFRLNRDPMTMQRIGLMQEFTSRSKRRLRAARAEDTVQVMTAQRRLAVAMVKQQTALAWFERHYAEAGQNNLKRQVEAVRLEVAAADSTYRQGQGTAANVLAARGLLAQLEDRLAAADYRVQAAQIALTRWLGVDADRPLAGAPAIETLPAHAHDVVNLVTEHPEVQVLDRELLLARAEVELARADRTPDWSVQVMYGARDKSFGDMISVGVSIPLPVNRADRQDRALATRLATAAQAEAERDNMRRDHEARIRTLHEEWQSALKRRDRYRIAVIPLAIDRMTTSLAAYRGGQAPLTEVLNARRDEAEVQLQALDIELQAARAWAELSFINPPDDQQINAVPNTDEPGAGEITP